MTQTFQEALVQKTLAEWDWFGKDLGRDDKFIGPNGKTTTAPKSGSKLNPRKETVEPFAGRVADYWLAIESVDYNKILKDLEKKTGTKIGRLDGTIDIAWSAAFISYCMQAAGAGKAFPYASGHARWIVRAISNKAKNRIKADLVGYRMAEEPLQVGDLVGRARKTDDDPKPLVTYGTAVARGWFTSHTDIVVEIDQANRKATVVGGNVGQSVSKVQINLDAQGRPKAEGAWFVHIRNNIAFPKPGDRAASNLSINVG